MSTTLPQHNCQELTTELERELAVYSEALWNKLGSHPSITTALLQPQLALAASYLSRAFARQVVVLPLSAAKSRAWGRMVAAWHDALPTVQHWHLIAGELTPQEQAGHITTDLSRALHYLLNEAANHHFIVPEEALSTLIPSQEAYQALRHAVHVGESIALHILVERLVELGYTRSTTSLEPGSIRARGEQLDIRHPVLDGHYTVTWYGKIIESIVHHQGRRSATVQSLIIPPVRFPDSTTPLATTLSACVAYQPQHVTAFAERTVIYDAFTVDVSFPWQPVGEIQKELASTPAYILYENWERVKNFLDDHPHQTVTYCRTALAQQVIELRTLHALIVSEAALLPPAAAEQPISYQQGVALLANLREGKAAVHSDHGIGVYEGLQTRTIGNVTRDYLILRYTAGDTLSVPVEYAHKVTAYLGEAIPKLNALGGTTWAVARKKAKHDAAKFARALLTTAQARAGNNREPYYLDPAVEEQLAASFPYALTPDQEAAWQAVRFDLQQAHPMDRLIVGDVGFGKTEIAIRAASHIASNDKQVAVLAPTTLLVQQHADTFLERLPQWRNQIAVVSRFTTSTMLKKDTASIASGQARIVIGTHALLSKSVTWKNLAAVIIDEEQRFGVQHKEHFKKIRSTVDVLSLSATPIPRTLSMAMSGLKELSIISTPPEGRKSVATYVGSQNDDIMAQAITRELARGGQVYVVAPKIRGLAAWTQRIAKLVPGARMAMVHGRLENKQLAALMHQFDAGDIDVLVASTIIENGLDVPNANTLIVLHATHFGLSELYQLRGRIGRRDRQGHAYFLYDQHELTSVQRQRLTALTEATRLGSGWTLAQRDLEIRGAGNLLGAEQSGTVNAIGVQLYLDMVHQAIDGDEATLTHRDVEVHLPLSAVIPATYIADIAQRTHYYQLLSRAASLEPLAQVKKNMEKYFGTFTNEVHNLYQLLQLQHVAAAAGVTLISFQMISPSDEEPYPRLIIEGRALPALLNRLHRLGNWVVRDNALTLDVDAIGPEFVTKLMTVLQ